MGDNIYIYDEKTKTRRKYSAADIEELIADSGSELSSDTSSDDLEVKLKFFEEKSILSVRILLVIIFSSFIYFAR